MASVQIAAIYFIKFYDNKEENIACKVRSKY